MLVIEKWTKTVEFPLVKFLREMRKLDNVKYFEVNISLTRSLPCDLWKMKFEMAADINSFLRNTVWKISIWIKNKPFVILVCCHIWYEASTPHFNIDTF